MDLKNFDIKYFEEKKNIILNIYKKYFDRFTNIPSFDDLYDIVVDEISDLLKDYKEIDESIYLKLKINISSKKGKWIDNEINNANSPFNKSLEWIKPCFDNSSTIIEECDTFEKYKKKVVDEITNWRKDVNSKLCEYKFLDKKNKRAKEKSLIIDMRLELLKMIVEDYKKSKNNNYEFQLNSLIGLSTDTTNRIKLKPSTEKSGIYTYDCGEDSTGLKYQYSLTLEDLKDVPILDQAKTVINKVFQVLNENDLELFHYILKNKKSNFFNDGKVQFIISDACMEIYGYVNTTKKQQIQVSLIRMATIRVNAFRNSSKLSGMTTSLLSNDMVFETDANKTIVTVTVGEIYRNELINGNITKVYKNAVKKVEDNADAKKILFLLQKERLVRYYNRNKDFVTDEYLIHEVDYTFFSQSVVFANKRKDKVIARIEKALNKVKKAEIVLIDYKRRGDYFKLIYAPIKQEEIIDMEERLKNIKTAS